MFITQISLIIMLWIIMHLMTFKKKLNNKTPTPFECGFNTFINKMPLSIHFTLLIFIFLLFDVELSILISSNWKISIINKNWIMTMFNFLTALIISLVYEILKKIIKWVQNM